jgi:hypothetical protein
MGIIGCINPDIDKTDVEIQWSTVIIVQEEKENVVILCLFSFMIMP